MYRDCVFTLKALGATLILAIIPLLSPAAMVQYHESSSAAIGHGYDAERPSTKLANVCLEYDGEKNVDGGDTGGQGDLEIKVVHNMTELLQVLGVSASVEARTGFFKGGASFSEKRSYSFSEDSIVWIVSSKTILGRYELQNPRPGKLLKELNASQVIRRCGSEIVTEETLGAIVAVIYEATNVSSTQKQELGGAIDAIYKGASKYSASSRFRTAVQQVRQTSTVTNQIHYRGGPGSEVLAQAVAEPENLAGLGEAIAKYLRMLTKDNARPLNYTTSSISQFSDVQIESAPNTDEDRLWEMYQAYSKITGLIKRIDTYIAPTGENEKHIAAEVGDAVRMQLQSDRNRYEKARDQLRSAGLACLAHERGCEMPQIAELPRVNWPTISSAPDIARACDLPYLSRAYLGIPPIGTTFGVQKVVYVINAKPGTVASVYRIEGANRETVQLVPLLNLATPSQAAIDFAAHGNVLPRETCGAQLDLRKAAVSVSINVPRRYKAPSGVRIEVEDIYGRKTSMEIDERLDDQDLH